jgi:hypothetical protein
MEGIKIKINFSLEKIPHSGITNNNGTHYGSE